MSAETVALVGALIHEHPALTPVLAEHLLDNDGEVLPDLLLEHVAGWLATHAHDAPATCRQVLAWLNTQYLRGNDDVREVIGDILPDLGVATPLAA